MISVDEIRQIVENGANGKINRETIDAVNDTCPYFVVPSILYLQQHKGELDAEEKNAYFLPLLLHSPTEQNSTTLSVKTPAHFQTFIRHKKPLLHPTPTQQSTHSSNDTATTTLKK